MNHEPYVRSINYYETDQMAVVHHSNYIRYFEEARTDFLRKNGVNFCEVEEKYGIMFPVLDVQCSYKKSARLHDVLYIYVTLKSFTGVRFGLDYQVKFADGSLCASGYTLLGILNRNYMPVSLKRKAPEIYHTFTELLQEESDADPAEVRT